VRHSFALAVAVAAVGLMVAGCGSSSKSTATTSQSAASTPAQGTSAASGYASTSASGAAAPAGGAAATVSSKRDKLGTILASGPRRMTVYLFEADKGASSACSGACARVWPPVRSAGEAKVGGSAVAADLGTITRSDGSKQVTYRGHPLYFFAKDGDKSDAYGQGIKSFGAAWYVLSPSGSKIDKS
jgi:predicted lipoprotein with Yx(FWY)xxD motif